MKVNEDMFKHFATALRELSSAKDGFAVSLRALGVAAPRAAKIAMTTEMNEAFTRLVRAKDQFDDVRALESLLEGKNT